MILILVIAASPAFAGLDGLTLTMVDVGAAECIIIFVDGEMMIVDAGYAKSWETIDQAVQDTEVAMLIPDSGVISLAAASYLTAI